MPEKVEQSIQLNEIRGVVIPDELQERIKTVREICNRRDYVEMGKYALHKAEYDEKNVICFVKIDHGEPAPIYDPNLPTTIAEAIKKEEVIKYSPALNTDIHESVAAEFGGDKEQMIA
jgi:hypothetical protein